MIKDIHKRKFIFNLLTGITYISLSKLLFLKKVNAKNKPNVVILGSGIGGASCLKYLNKISDLINLIVIDKNKKIRTGPFSNLVIGDIMEEADITFFLNKKKYNNVKFIFDEAKYIDSNKKFIEFSDGNKINFDYLIISPGIGYKENIIDGYRINDKVSVPHCWDGDGDLNYFKKRLGVLENNSLIIISSPDYPYRCPPAPYERASLISNYFKKKKINVKVLILDSKDSFTKQQNFFKEWSFYYKNTIEWVSRKNGGKVVFFDRKSNLVKNDQGESFKADFINIIPDQKAAPIIFNSNLVSNNDDWCQINPITFQLINFKDIYVVGDSINAWDMPKSAFSANSQAKVLSLNLINRILEKDYIDPVFLNTCYSFSKDDRAFSISAWYRLNSSEDRIVSLGSSESQVRLNSTETIKEAKHAYGWYKTLVNDIFL